MPDVGAIYPDPQRISEQRKYRESMASSTMFDKLPSMESPPFGQTLNQAEKVVIGVEKRWQPPSSDITEP